VEQQSWWRPGRGKAPNYLIQKVISAYTSQRCSECGYPAAGNRKSQAVFACLACAVTLNADVNAARNIAAGHAVTARGRPGLPGRANREPHLLLLSA
jgi:putative transposase